MNRKDVIDVLKMENDLITFDPITGEEIDVKCLNELNKKCYIAHEEAIEFLKQSIPIEWIEKQKVDFQNEDYPFNYCRGFQDGYNDCIDYLISEWKEENEHKESD